MKFKTWKEARFDILCGTIIPVLGGAAGALPVRGWHDLWVFLTQSWWSLGLLLWLMMAAFIVIMAENKLRRIVGLIVVTIWVWGVVLSGLHNAAFQQPPPIQRHIDPPDYWWRGGNS